MAYLLAVTALWAFSFSLIGEYLAGQVDSDFAVLTRVLLAALLFLPLVRWRGLTPGLVVGLMAVGALQFGVTYLCLYRAFAYLTVPEVLLFTVTTPLYVTLFDDALRRQFAPLALLAAAVAVIGAAIIRYDGITNGFLFGFTLIQLANAAFAAGQVGYKHLLNCLALQRRRLSGAPAHRSFFFFFLGALCVTGPAWWLFGDPAMLPQTAAQWSVLLWLGIAASGLGLFFWNQGARRVDAGTLAVMNNLLVPAGLLVNLVIWGASADLLRLTAGGGVIVLALWINHRFRAVSPPDRRCESASRPPGR